MKTAFMALLAILAVMTAVAIGCGDDDDDDQVVDNSDLGGSGDGSASDDDDDTDDDTTDDDTGDDDSPVTVAIVFQSTSTENDTYATVLESQGMDTFVVHVGDILSDSFKGADVILVDALTIWGDVTTAGYVKDSGLPVLGMGSGGLQLFGEMNLKTNLDATDGIVYNYQSGFDVSAPASKLFTAPFDLGAEEGDTLTVLTGTADLYAIDLVPPPSGVTVLATREGDGQRSGITIEQARYLSWGLDLYPSQLSEVGAKLLVNSVMYLDSL